MYATVLSTILALSSSAMGWQLSIYNLPDCNQQAETFEYIVASGEGDMPYCAGVGSKSKFPEGIRCSYFRDKGFDGPHDCTDAQWDGFKSWRVTRGKVDIFGTYDTHPSQPDDQRCGAIGWIQESKPGVCQSPAWGSKHGWLAREGPPVKP